MHSYGWSMVRTFEQKSTLMTFQKKGWIAHIHVQPEDSLVQIDVSIGPDEKMKKVTGGSMPNLYIPGF